MNKTALNFLLDCTLACVFLTLSLITAVLRFLYPLPTSAKGWCVWGQSYDAWSEFQFLLYCLFALLIILHVMLHWGWVCGVLTSRLSKWKQRTIRWDTGTQTLYGVGTLIVALNLLGALFIWASLTTRPPSVP